MLRTFFFHNCALWMESVSIRLRGLVVSLTGSVSRSRSCSRSCSRSRRRGLVVSLSGTVSRSRSRSRSRDSVSSCCRRGGGEEALKVSYAILFNVLIQYCTREDWQEGGGIPPIIIAVTGDSKIKIAFSSYPADSVCSPTLGENATRPAHLGCVGHSRLCWE